MSRFAGLVYPMVAISPGNFRNIEVRIDNADSELVFVGEDDEVRKPLG